MSNPHEEFDPVVHTFSGPGAARLPDTRVRQFSLAQVSRLYQNSPEYHKDVASFAAFVRLVRLVEEAHNLPVS